MIYGLCVCNLFILCVARNVSVVSSGHFNITVGIFSVVAQRASAMADGFAFVVCVRISWYEPYVENVYVD